MPSLSEQEWQQLRAKRLGWWLLRWVVLPSALVLGFWLGYHGKLQWLIGGLI